MPPPTSPLVAISAPAPLTRSSPRGKLREAYLRALEGAGLSPRIVPPSPDPAEAERLLADAAGLVLSGGADVAPARYGAEPHPNTGAPYPDRDATEIALLEAARRRGLPVLAICRGVQLLNVALGGTLIQDIEAERPEALPHASDGPRDARIHDVLVAPGRLGDALGTRSIRVNSFHHQALDRVAEGLKVTAVAPDGIVEGVETPDESWWVVGVQWHPEELVGAAEPWDRRLFAAFAAACRGVPA